MWDDWGVSVSHSTASACYLHVVSHTTFGCWLVIILSKAYEPISRILVDHSCGTVRRCHACFCCPSHPGVAFAGGHLCDSQELVLMLVWNFEAKRKQGSLSPGPHSISGPKTQIKENICILWEEGVQCISQEQCSSGGPPELLAIVQGERDLEGKRWKLPQSKEQAPLTWLKEAQGP